MKKKIAYIVFIIFLFMPTIIESAESPGLLIETKDPARKRTVKESIFPLLKALDKINQEVLNLQSSQQDEQLQGINNLLGIQGTIKNTYGIINRLWNSTRIGSVHAEVQDNLGALANRICRFETPQQKQATLRFHIQLVQAITTALLSFEEKGFIWNKITSDTYKKENLGLLLQHLNLLNELKDHYMQADRLSPESMKNLYKSFELNIDSLGFLDSFRIWLGGSKFVDSKLLALQKLYALVIPRKFPWGGEIQDVEDEDESPLQPRHAPIQASSAPRLDIPEPTNTEIIRRIAREVVMVDENYDSLTNLYETILTDAFSIPFRASSTGKDVLILGAGMAGLVAGKILKSRGYNVTILEANKTRVGGRVKTFRTEPGKESPFSVPELYGEAGAMRIPSTHPLVQSLISRLGITQREFYNVDVRRDNPYATARNTWVRANGIQQRSSSYASPKIPAQERHLGFDLPAKYQGKTAKELLEAALQPLIDEFTKPLKDSGPDQNQDPRKRNELLVNAWADIIKKYDNVSMYEFLQQVYPEKVVIDYIGTLQNLTSRLFLSFIHSFIDTFYINPTTKYVEIVGGNCELPYKLADSLDRGHIVMNARAIEIQWATPKRSPAIGTKNLKAINRGRPGVYVRTLGERETEDHKVEEQPMEREFTADYLISSIPFSALRFVDVHPLFSYGKHRAITELHYDSATKVLLEFSERFWEWNEREWQKTLPDEYKGHDSIGGGSITDSPNRFIYYPSHPPEPKIKGGVILASYTWSDDASRWDSLLHEDRIAYALRGLTDMYGKGILRFYTGKSQTESWMQNFYAYGEAAVFSPGQIIGLYPYISIPEGPVHIAGEHASMKHAWIEGAIESGIRTALEIIEKDLNVDNVEDIKERKGSPSPQRALVPFYPKAAVAEVKKEPRRMTVASYLYTRLQSLGLKRLFGVAGNYTAPFLDTILEDTRASRLQITGTANELCAGYAADGYARILGKDGLGAVAVTFGVGSFSVLNAIAGSFVEQVPVVIINGAPTNKEFKNQRQAGLLFSHMIPYQDSNIEAFRQVTAAAERISNASEAPLQIDAALKICITRRQPVYLEVLEDVWRAHCEVPSELEPITRSQTTISVSDVDGAIEKTLSMISGRMNKQKSKPVFWAGVEIQRLGLQELFLSLLKTTGFYYTTAVFGKSLVSEDTPGFLRVGLPQNASCVIGLGAWTTSKDIGGKSILTDRDKVIVSQGSAFVGGEIFSNVPLEHFMTALAKRFTPQGDEKKGVALAAKFRAKESWVEPLFSAAPKITCEPSAQLDYDNFYKTLNDKWIKDSSDTIAVVDSSFPLIASQQGLHIKTQDGFVAQAAWLSIGYAAPAAIGIKCAVDDNKLGNKRMVVIAGDGAFQETCQAVSSYGMLNQNTVVFIIANGIYGIEQKLVNPNPFRARPADYSDKNIFSYNELSQWNYAKLADVFGFGEGCVVETVADLENTIALIQKETTKSFIVQVRVPKLSIPAVLKPSLDNPGEDEHHHPAWPPKDVY